MTGVLKRDVAPVISVLSGMFDDVFTRVESVRKQLATCFDICGEDPLTRRDIAAIHPRLKHELRNASRLLRGIGVIFSPGLLMDARLWIDWWVIGEDGAITPTDFDFDPDSLDFYDYTHAEWFLSPQQGTVRCLVGPYVDFSGLNDYIVTATTPVNIGDGFIGVAGADLRVDEIERRLYMANRPSGGDLVLVNSCDRIVASTSAHYIAGSLLPPDTAADGTTASVSHMRYKLPTLSWSVVLPG